ncbi:ZnMc domain-containing protein [Favolaschia claudopus]|uniref:ZnMc domain-containing protein n=1 Tax=Favolaschia claudopus TaxID=2862362 RepID=A0AAV9ZQZ3_9AGAR
MSTQPTPPAAAPPPPPPSQPAAPALGTGTEIGAGGAASIGPSAGPPPQPTTAPTPAVTDPHSVQTAAGFPLPNAPAPATQPESTSSPSTAAPENSQSNPTQPAPAINVRKPVESETVSSPSAVPPTSTSDASSSATNTVTAGTQLPTPMPSAGANIQSNATPLDPVTQASPGTATLGFNAFPTTEICILDIPTAQIGTGSADCTELMVGTVQQPTDIAAMVQMRLGLLWDVGATVTYTYLQGPSGNPWGPWTDAQQGMLDSVFAEWFSFANVNFQRNDAGPMMSFSFSASGPSFARLGTVNFTPTLPRPIASVNFSSVSAGPEPTASDRAILLHETGHLLGLIHEHRSPLSGGSVVLDLSTISPNTTLLGWNQGDTANQLINVYNGYDLTNYDQPDSTSIMKYFGVTQPNLFTPPSFSLSDKDKAFMVIMYPRPRPLNTAPEWTLDRALRVFEVNNITAKTILVAYAKQDYTAGRTAFLTFLMNKRFGIQKAKIKGDSLLETAGELLDDMLRWRTCAIAIPPAESTDTPDVGIMTGSAARAVITKLSELWDPSTPITYSFLGGTAVQQAKVRAVIASWVYANISFKLVAYNGMLRISFNPAGGSWSYVGTQALAIPAAQATMNLGWVENTGSIENGIPTYITTNEAGTILHEFGHVLGLLHEHQSPERSKKLTLDDGAVYSYYARTQGWDRATIQSQILDTYASGDVSNYSVLDTTSIMMYFMPAEMNLQHVNVPVNNQLSDLDKAYVVINYPGQTTDKTWTLDYALKKAGVDTTTSKSITAAAAKGNITLVRTLFTAFQVEQRNQRYAGLNPDGPENTTNDSDNMEYLGAGWCQLDDTIPLPNAPSIQDGVAHGVTVTADKFWKPADVIRFTFLHGDTPVEAATDYRCNRVRRVLKYYENYIGVRFQEDPGVKRDSDFERNSDLQRNCPVRVAFGSKLDEKRDDRDIVLLGWARLGTSAETSGLHEHSSGAKWATVWFGNQPLNKDSDVTSDELRRANRNLYHELLLDSHKSPTAATTQTKYDTDEYLVATGYDRKSIMLYPGQKLKGGAGETELTFTPSKTDLALLRAMYPDLEAGTPKFKEALAALDLTASEIASLHPLVVEAIRPKASVQSTIALRERVAQLIHLHRASLANWTLPVLPPDLTTSEADKTGGERKGGGTTGRKGRGGAQHTLNPSTALKAIEAETAPGFLYQLVQALKQFFQPGGNQMFTLQFPGRYLDINSFAWDTSTAGIYGQFIKPTAVNESEFRLVDQLYDLQDVVVGPNGTNLSIVYEQVLNNFLPKFVNNNLFEQQDQIRHWLLKDVPMTQWVRDIIARQNARELALADRMAGTVNELEVAASLSDNSTTVSTAVNTAKSTVKAVAPMFDLASRDVNAGESLNRIELSELLMNDYLYAKQDWELERDNMIMTATTKDISTADGQMKLNALTRQLAHITDTRQAQLASKYSDAVVRGYAHTVRRYMGYLDIKDPAEALQDAKDSLREAAMSSLDGSMHVYPIQMTPLDWFEGLSTSFTMEDLTQDVDLIRTQIDFKSSELDSLNSQLVALQMNSRGNPSDLQKKVQDAQDALDSAQSNLALQYTTNVIELAKTYLNSQGKLDDKGLEAVAASEAGFGIDPDLIEQLPDQLKKVQDAQNSLTAASRALSTLMAAQALAEATETTEQQQQITMRIQSLTGELRELQARWKVLTKTTGGQVTRPDLGSETADVDLDPNATLELPPDTSSGGSRWTTIMFTYTAEEARKTYKDKASAESQQWSCNVWFASASGGANREEASFDMTSNSTSSAITVAFRATLVTVDRGGWFQPQFFKESQAFYKINPNITWNNGDKDHPRGLLQGYPIGYLIVKDMMIRIVHTASSSEDAKRAERESSAASGGIFCFSYSQSSASSSSESASSFSQYNNGYIVKIPGPQILGYMMQKLDADETEMMPAKLPDNFFIPDDEVDKTIIGGGPASGANPGGPAHAPEPTITPSKMREVLDKLLNEKIGELFGGESESRNGKGKEKRPVFGDSG